MKTGNIRSNARRLPITAVLAAALACVGACAAWAQQPEITDVTLSPDSERLVIKMRGSAVHPEALALRSPARLALDFKGARATGSKHTIKDVGGFIRGIGVRSAPGGARVEVEFADDRVPDYRIRPMGSNLLVFFSWDAEAEARRSAREEGAATKPTNVGKKADSVHHEHWTPAPATKGTTGLFIKKADVEDGLIVLDVSEGKDPNSTYRITLGVDLGRRGFRSASVRKRPKTARSREAPSDRWSAAAGSSGRANTKGANPAGLRSARGASGRLK